MLPEKLVIADNSNLPEHLVTLINEKMVLVSRMQGNPAICRNAFLNLPDLNSSGFSLSEGAIKAETLKELDEDIKKQLFETLMELNPWRKGPFNIFGIHIDTEWRSDMKWDRIESQIGPLKGRKILDIGCSNGYYMFRMLPHDPELVIGLDPFSNFYYQFLSIQKYVRSDKLHFIPSGFEDLSGCDDFFDTVFCMGILYHRKSPFELLEKIAGLLKKDGELILETIVLPGESDTVLCPESRYAKMRNVYFIPTVKTLVNWLLKSGFKDVRILDVSKTTLEEQRKTDWIMSESLDSFLDPDDHEKTIEGYPAPIRAALSAISK